MKNDEVVNAFPAFFIPETVKVYVFGFIIAVLKLFRITVFEPLRAHAKVEGFEIFATRQLLLIVKVKTEGNVIAIMAEPSNLSLVMTVKL